MKGGIVDKGGRRSRCGGMSQWMKVGIAGEERCIDVEVRQQVEG